MILFANVQRSVKVRLVSSKFLLLIILIANSKMLLGTRSDGYIKDNKYIFFVKVDVANVLLKLNYS